MACHKSLTYMLFNARKFGIKTKFDFSEGYLDPTTFDAVPQNFWKNVYESVGHTVFTQERATNLTGFGMVAPSSNLAQSAQLYSEFN